MKHVVIGAGQIGSALVHHLVAQGEEVIVIRRSATEVSGVRTVSADVLDAEVLQRELSSAGAVYHCIHAAYDRVVWRRELPLRERVIMDAAEKVGIPVVFPESVYAFGRSAQDLREGTSVAPFSPLGEIRAELLAARAAHPAQTISVVASDLFGPTANDGSVATITMLRPLARGKRAWVPADLDAEHSWTYLPDLAGAMVYAATHAGELTAIGGEAILHAPTNAPRSYRGFARDVGEMLAKPVKISEIPQWPLAVAARFNPMMCELRAQQYLWRQPSVIRPGRLTTEIGLNPTPWHAAVKASLLRA